MSEKITQEEKIKAEEFTKAVEQLSYEQQLKVAGVIEGMKMSNDIRKEQVTA